MDEYGRMILTHLDVYRFVEHGLQICLHVFHHNEYVANLLICYYVVKLDRVRIIFYLAELFHNLYFSYYLLGSIARLKNVVHIFDCNGFLRFQMYRLNNLSVSPLAKDFFELVIVF